MKKRVKTILKISLILIGAGIILTVGGMLFGGLPGVIISKDGVFSPYDAPQYTLPKTRIEESERIDYKRIYGIDFSLDSPAEIIFRPSEDDYYYLEYTLPNEYGTPEYEVADQILTFRQKSSSPRITMDFCSLFRKEPEPKVTLYIPDYNTLNTISVSHRNTFQIFDILLYLQDGFYVTDGQSELKATILDTPMYDRLKFTMSSDVLEAENLKVETLFVSSKDTTCEFTNLYCSADAAFELESCDCTLSDVSISGSNESDGSFRLQNSYAATRIVDFDSSGAVTIGLYDASLDFYPNNLVNLDCQSRYGDLYLTLPDATAYDYDMLAKHGTITFPGMEDSIFSEDADTQSCQTSGDYNLTVKVRADYADITISEGRQR